MRKTLAAVAAIAFISATSTIPAQARCHGCFEAPMLPGTVPYYAPAYYAPYPPAYYFPRHSYYPRAVRYAPYRYDRPGRYRWRPYARPHYPPRYHDRPYW